MAELNCEEFLIKNLKLEIRRLEKALERIKELDTLPGTRDSLLITLIWRELNEVLG